MSTLSSKCVGLKVCVKLQKVIDLVCSLNLNLILFYVHF